MGQQQNSKKKKKYFPFSIIHSFYYYQRMSQRTVVASQCVGVVWIKLNCTQTELFLNTFSFFFTVNFYYHYFYSGDHFYFFFTFHFVHTFSSMIIRMLNDEHSSNEKKIVSKLNFCLIF